MCAGEGGGGGGRHSRFEMHGLVAQSPISISTQASFQP